MQKAYFILLFYCTNAITAQNAFHNYGNVQIHDKGVIGFHTNLINDGMFNQNLGFAGFFNIISSLTVSGSQIPRFFDFETNVKDHLFLEINTEISNSLIYTNGEIFTPRNTPSISLDFLSDAVYVLENDIKHTDGYQSYQGEQPFSFSIGDDNKLRPLIIPFYTNITKYSAAYFNEDPNFPSTFNQTFDTSKIENILQKVSTNEFWDFNGTSETQVTLTFNSQSNLIELVDHLQNLRVVGWNVVDKTWRDLGNFQFTGTINSGSITSTPFIPNSYEVITFGTQIRNEEITVFNEISPNNDGTNDTFVIKGIHLFQNNLKIFNRWGHLVYKTINYQNDWNGINNIGVFLNNHRKLPVGTYFFSLELLGENKQYTGWIYLNY